MESMLQNFIMARSTQEVAEGLLKLKGCLIGLIDGDDESDLLLRTNLLKLRTCLIEFNTTNFFPGISGVQQLLVCLASAGMAGMPQFCGFGSF
ncbi:hypothetical protein MTR_4g111845 [Medicago truncatula]|uniref:Uncharacterized protein n=1 Tax=Medicago truncatula TaxID=3880 RepID=A0A072URU4_MEDTR|nr:hypothetical protein MTR_4g111845 [Medicago truncatula]